jgi:hypothetical protein
MVQNVFILGTIQCTFRVQCMYSLYTFCIQSNVGIMYIKGTKSCAENVRLMYILNK